MTENDYCLLYDIASKRITELEKENAELDMKRKAERQIFQGIVEKKNEQLTKAKEIIKKLYTKQDDYCVDCTCYNFLENMRAEAEQFLKEIEK